mgnify:FL=1
MGIILKSEREMEVMREGGKKLAKIKAFLRKNIKPGVSAAEIEKLAERLIKEEKGKPSFKMVPGYRWATCVNVNHGVVHGIPTKEIIFRKGDVVSIDVGLFYKGFHTDTSFSVALEGNGKHKDFLDIGEKALDEGIRNCYPGKRIFDISQAIESVLRLKGYNPVRALVGHGIGRDLHEDPQIPCFVDGKREDSMILSEGSVLAIEVMYSYGNGEIQVEADGWTITTQDGKISALFEDTVAITKNGPIVLTR